MKKSKTTFLLSEICLAILLLLCVRQIFADEKPQKRVAVIVEKSGDEKWDSFFNGVKQAARMQNIHLIICNTDEIENAQEERALIYEQLDNQVDAFIIQAAPEGSSALLHAPVYLLSDGPSRTALLPARAPGFLHPSVHLSDPDAQEVRCSACHPAYCSCRFVLPHKVPHCEDNFLALEMAVRQTGFLFVW